MINRPIPLIGALSSRTTRCGSESPPASNRYGDSAACRAFLRLAVDVGIAEQPLLRPRGRAPVEAENDDVHMRLAARVRAPGEGAVRERDLQPAALGQDRPELGDLLALGDRVGGNEADPGTAAPYVRARLDEPGGGRNRASRQYRRVLRSGALVRAGPPSGTSRRRRAGCPARRRSPPAAAVRTSRFPAHRRGRCAAMPQAGYAHRSGRTPGSAGCS